jgi:hypothetical protein
MGAGLAVAGLGAMSGYLQSQGARNQAQQQQAMLSPRATLSRYKALNPEFHRAYSGITDPNATAYEQALRQFMQNPGQLDPELMNQAYMLSAQRTPQDMWGAMGMIGQGVPGIGQAIPFAAQAAQTGRDVNTATQFGLAQADLLRQDLNWIEQMKGQMMGQSFGQQSQQAQYAVPPWSSILGNAIQGGLAAYGTLPQGQQQQQQGGYTPGGIGGGIPDPQWGSGTQPAQGGILPPPQGLQVGPQQPQQQQQQQGPWSSQGPYSGAAYQPPWQQTVMR